MEELARDTVGQYYNMDEGQRAFILNVIDSCPEWNKYDYMKSLMLYNKMKEHGCQISDEELSPFIDELDNNMSSLNYWLKKLDEEFRISKKGRL